MHLDLNITESRMDRFRRSALLNTGVRKNEFEIKIAEKYTEWEGAFRLLYEVYFDAGYVVEPVPSKIMFGLHHFHANTVVFIANFSDTPVSTLTQFFDNPVFGLPSDQIYKKELDALRAEGRIISEIGGLATRKKFRWQNLLLHLCQAMYWHSRSRKVDDLCIAVNPKHVSYYKTVFLFETIGPITFHPGVHAPAVLMRLNLDHFPEKLMAVYNHMEVEYNLYDYFHRLEGTKITDYSIPLKKKILNGSDTPRMDSDSVNLLINANMEVLNSLTPKHVIYLKKLYPTIFQ